LFDATHFRLRWLPSPIGHAIVGVRGNRGLRHWPTAAVASMQTKATTACVTYVQAQVEASFFPSNSLNFNFLVFYMRVRLDTCDFLLFFLPLTK
jgi:hypothetical protein